MASTKERNRFRRQIHTIEHDLLVGGKPASGAEIEAALGPLAAGLGEAAQAEVRALRGAAAGGPAAQADYVEEHGCAGVRRFLSRGGAWIYQLSAETFPDHVNNIYLVLPPPGEGPRRLTLFDAGSQFAQSTEDLRRGAEVLGRIYGLSGILGEVHDVVISHGHIDHFGGVSAWQQKGARVHVHTFDLRVLTRFDERVIEASVYLRAFLARAGCPGGTLSELVQMNLYAKRMFQSVPVDRELSDGDEVNGWRVHHTPGHCPGQVMMQVDSVLLTADHLLSRITPHQSPESITPWTGLDHYLLSLGRTAQLIRREGIELALGGHEEPMPDPGRRVEEVAAFHERRLVQVLELCRDEVTLWELTGKLFGEPAGYNQLLALEEAAAHVEYLQRRGRLVIANIEDLQREEDPVIRYRASGAGTFLSPTSSQL